MNGSLLSAGTRTLGVAQKLAADLATSARPATRILEDYLSAQRETPCTLRLHVTGPDPHPGVRELNDEEKFRLGAPGLQQCYHRTGLLLYDLAEIAAVTTLTWLPARLRVEACIDLARGAVPAGKALPGMRRGDLRAMALTERERERDPADGLCGGIPISVTSSAVLIVEGWQVAIATERITRSFTELLAGHELRADCAHDLAGTSPLVPSRDRRLNPALERALPADSDNDPPGYRRGRELREMLFGSGEWHPVTVRAWWQDKSSRWVVQVEWSIAGEMWGESYLADPDRIREA